jgi:uncharacterized membrane protein YebE (DUF533 family)
MSKRTILPAATAVALSMFIAGAAVAGPDTPRLDHREHNQRARIEQGVRSDALTRPETRRLVHGQVHLRRMEARAKSDGDVTRRERARLEHAADVQGKRIYRQKHDAQTRR